MDKQPGFGELLRHLSERVDRGARHVYGAVDLAEVKPRCAPLMRTLATGATAVTAVTAITRINHPGQGAISQALALMQADGLLEKDPLPDAPQAGLRLIRAGQRLQRRLPHWPTTFDAIKRLQHARQPTTTDQAAPT